jgi:hypothetical protein
VEFLDFDRSNARYSPLCPTAPWPERGNAAGAIEVLRALGFLKLPTAVAWEPAERVRFTLDLGDDRDLDAEIDHLLRPDDPA